MTTYAIADDIAWVSREEYDNDGLQVAYVCALPHGPTIVLEGSACLVWLALGEGCGTLDDIARSAADQVGLTAESVVGDVEALLTQLVEMSYVRAL